MRKTKIQTKTEPFDKVIKPLICPYTFTMVIRMPDDSGNKWYRVTEIDMPKEEDYE